MAPTVGKPHSGLGQGQERSGSCVWKGKDTDGPELAELHSWDHPPEELPSVRNWAHHTKPALNSTFLGMHHTFLILF